MSSMRAKKLFLEEYVLIASILKEGSTVRLSQVRLNLCNLELNKSEYTQNI